MSSSFFILIFFFTFCTAFTQLVPRVSLNSTIYQLSDLSGSPVDCQPGYYLVDFYLAVANNAGSVTAQYHYNCSQVPYTSSLVGFTLVSNLYTWNCARCMNFLERFEIRCTNGGHLNRFISVVEPLNKMHYDILCTTPPPVEVKMSCTSKYFTLPFWPLSSTCSSSDYNLERINEYNITAPRLLSEIDTHLFAIRGFVQVNEYCSNNGPSQFAYLVDYCIFCNTPCETCNLRDHKKCLKCNNSIGYYCTIALTLQSVCEKECVNFVPLGYYLNMDGLYYDSCYKVCEYCTKKGNDMANFCTKCIQGLYLRSDAMCVPTCPKYYFAEAETRECKPCSERCISCPDVKSCYECDKGLFYDTVIKICVNSCPPGTFGDYSPKPVSCTFCTTPCLTCTSRTVCTSCVQKYYLSNTRCIGCPPACSSCTSDSVCTGCVDNNDFIYENKCVSKCPPHFYYSKSTGTCLNCQSVCYTCKNNSSYCIQCAQNTYKLPLQVPFDGIDYTCETRCPEKYYEDKSTNTCKTCFEMGYVMMNNECSTTCSPGYTANQDRICVKCGKFLLYDMCVEACPKYYITNGDTNICVPSNLNPPVPVTCYTINPCQHYGICYQEYENGKLKCKCPLGYYGDYCEELQDFRKY